MQKPRTAGLKPQQAAAMRAFFPHRNDSDADRAVVRTIIRNIRLDLKIYGPYKGKP